MSGATSDQRERGLGQFRQARVGLHETAEALGPGLDDLEAGAHVVLPVGGALAALEHGAEAAGDRLDGGEGIVELVAEHAHEALPGLQLLLPQTAR